MEKFLKRDCKNAAVCAQTQPISKVATCSKREPVTNYPVLSKRGMFTEVIKAKAMRKRLKTEILGDITNTKPELTGSRNSPERRSHCVDVDIDDILSMDMAPGPVLTLQNDPEVSSVTSVRSEIEGDSHGGGWVDRDVVSSTATIGLYPAGTAIISAIAVECEQLIVEKVMALISWK